MLDLDARKQEILRAVIHAYIDDAEPVGSERIAHGVRLHVSPATIRNEMAALEELGFLSHPHTSAGRVPTDRAYRFYVNTLVEEEPSPRERTRLRRFLAGGEGEAPGHLAEEVARALAVVTEYASVVTAPALQRQMFKHLQLIQLSSTRVIAVIITDAGVVQGRAFDLADPLESEALDRLSQTVSRRLQGYALSEITEELLAEKVDEAAWQHRFLAEILRWMRAPLTGDRRVFIEGTSNILKQPEFHDARTARPVLSALEQVEVLDDLLEAATEGRVRVTIGSEHRHEGLRGTTVVSASYDMGGRRAGVLGIVGPTRMKYGKVISLVRYLADSVSEILTGPA